MLANLREQPWWTEADDAELDVMVHEFVRGVFIHRRDCRVCALGGPWCHFLVEAFEILTGWLHGRVLRSKASFLRYDQERREFAARLAA